MKVYLPLNKTGIEELEKCQETETNNLKIYEFSPEDYYYLESQNYIDYLNVECGCIIDLYEDDNIPNEKLNNALEITKILMNQSSEERFVNLAKEFIKIFELAIKLDTFVNIYCYGKPNIVDE